MLKTILSEKHGIELFINATDNPLACNIAINGNMLLLPIENITVEEVQLAITNPKQKLINALKHVTQKGQNYVSGQLYVSGKLAEYALDDGEHYYPDTYMFFKLAGILFKCDQDSTTSFSVENLTIQQLKDLLVAVL